MSDIRQVFHQFLRIFRYGIIRNFIQKIRYSFFFASLFEIFADSLFQTLCHPYDSLYAAIGKEELLARNEVDADSHETGVLVVLNRIQQSRRRKEEAEHEKRMRKLTAPQNQFMTLGQRQETIRQS